MQLKSATILEHLIAAFMAILKQVLGVGAIIDYRDRIESVQQARQIDSIEQRIAAIEPNQKAIAFNQDRLQQQALIAKIAQAQEATRSVLAVYLGQTLLLLLVGITILGITAFDGLIGGIEIVDAIVAIVGAIVCVTIGMEIGDDIGNDFIGGVFGAIVWAIGVSIINNTIILFICWSYLVGVLLMPALFNYFPISME